MPKTTGRRIALLMGCGKYDELPPLRAPLRDVAAMERMVRDPRIGNFSDVLTFNRGENPHTILESMETIITQTEPNDFILIYFSGHGKLDLLGHLYLALKRTRETALDATAIGLIEFTTTCSERARVQP